MPECYSKVLNKMAGKRQHYALQTEEKKTKPRTKDKMMTGSSNKETHEEADL